MTRVRLSPELSRAAVLMQSNRLDEAIAVCQRVLAKNKRDYNAHQMLGLIESMRGRPAAAVAHFERGLKINPRGAMLLCGLANAQRTLGAYDDALARYDAALAAEPGYPPAITGKADVLEHLGGYDAARELLDPLVAAGTENAESAHVYATLEQRAGRDEAAVALCRRHLSNVQLDAIARRKLLYCVGRSCEKLARYDESFEAYAAANALLRLPFRIADIERKFDRMRDVFTRERLAGYARASNTDELPVFVVSMPRSGSTLVEQILAAHPDVHGAGESDAIPARLRELRDETGHTFPEGVDTFDAPTLDRLAERYLGQLRALDANALRIVDKHLQNFRWLGFIALILPRARVINVRRDPMATCFSCWALPLEPAVLPYTTDLRDLGLYHNAYQRLITHWFDVLEIELLDVQYEDLVHDQETTSRRIIEFAGLPWSGACLRFHETDRQVSTASYDQVRKPIYTSALRRYEAYGERMAPLRDALES